MGRRGTPAAYGAQRLTPGLRGEGVGALEDHEVVQNGSEAPDGGAAALAIRGCSILGCRSATRCPTPLWWMLCC